MPNRLIELQKHLDFTDIIDGKFIVSIGIGPNREAVLLAVDPEYRDVPFGRDEEPSGALFPHSVADSPYTATAIYLKYGLIKSIELQGVDAAYPYVQPLDDDRTLVVSGRCDYRSGDPEKNAAIYDRYGEVVRRMVLGDGIESVQVSRSGDIWVSYFDEGVFSNFGWPCPPMGSDGLLCFDTDGNVCRHFTAPGGFDRIVDCYALNVAYDAVWVCYYTDFPVVRIAGDGTVRGWENEFGGARAVAVDQDRILLYGGYGEESARCVVQTIAGDRLVSPRMLDMRLPTGESLEGAQVFGRGSVLHAFVGTAWYQFDLAKNPI